MISGTESLESRLRYLEGMNRIHQALDRDLGIEALLQGCVEVILDLFEADRCILAFPCDPASDSIRFPFIAERAGLGLPPYPRDFSPVPESTRAVLAALLERAEPLALGHEIPFTVPDGNLDQFAIRSRLTIAIRPKPGPAWSLNLQQCTRDREWSDEEQRLFRDIAGRIKSALESLLLTRELRRSEGFLQAMTEAMPQMLWATDSAGKVEFVNKRWMEYTGQSWRQSLAEGGVEALHPDDRLPCLELWNRAVRTGDPYEAELRYRRADGAYLWHLVRAYPLRGEDGKILRWIGTCTDISEAKRIREEAERAREQLATILSGAAEAILALDAAGKIVYANDAAARLLGMPSAVAMMEPGNLIAAEERRDHVVCADEKGVPYPIEKIPTRLALQGIEAPPTVLRFRLTPRSPERWIVARAKPIFDAAGKVSLVIGLTQDITELKAKEEAVRRLEKLESLGKLAGGVAHDFNNLLVTINGYSDMGLQMTSEDPVLHEFFQEILRSGQRAAALTQQLLAYGRKQMVRPRKLNLNAVVGGMQKLLAQLMGEDIRLRMELAPELPLVQADPNQIEQAIINLAVNARDAMPQGGILTLETGTVELEAGHEETRPGPHVTLTVSDTGVGMDEAVMAKAFEPFFTTKEMGGGDEGRTGTGLGLASVYGTVKQCGGHIEVESAAGKGATFRIYLPVAEGQSSPPEPPAPPARGEDRPTGAILLVEDEDSVRHFTERVLAERGFKVLAARDGREAIGMAEHEPSLDLLIVDVMMRHLRGPELAERIRGLHPAARVLLTSGYPDDSALAHAGMEGSAFLQKPYRAEHLLETVDALLRTLVQRPG